MIPRLPDGFWEKVEKAGPVPKRRPDLGPCWLWTAARNGQGYGQVWLDGVSVSVHRLMVQVERPGALDGGLVPDHLCNVRHCCRPSHLDVVTTAENNRRRDADRTRCKRNHLLTFRGRGGRQVRCCRTCEAESRRARRAVVSA